MIKIRLMIFALLFTILGSPMAAIASDVSNALYSGTIVVSNNSTASSNVATVANISTDNLITGQYLNATANNTVMRNSSGADVPFQPGYTPSNAFWSMWVPSIGEDSYLTYILYTANSTGGEIRYFPGATGMTTSDSAGLELLGLSTNFTIAQGGWVDTDADSLKFLVHKPWAFQTRVSPTTDEQIDVRATVDTDCLDFVRVNADWVMVPDSVDFSFTDGVGNDEPFTVIAWVNFDDATTSTILSKWTAAGNQIEWIFDTSAGDLLGFSLSDPAGANTITVQSVAITGDEGAWHHYAATYDGTELNTGMELYRDGINATNVQGGAGAYVGMTNGTADELMGAFNAGAAGRLMDGLMAEIKVYSAELTPAEILADYNGEYHTADLVAWWRIDEGSGLPQDSSGNGHNSNQNLADWVNTFPNRYTIETFASNVSTDEHVVDVSLEPEPAMSTWATDINIGVNMGNGILPVKVLETQTLTAPAASVTFSNIGTKKDLWDSLAGVTSRHLMVMVNAKSPDAVAQRDVQLQFNSDTGNNYNYQYLEGENAVASAAASTGVANIAVFPISGTTYANAFDGGTVLIPHAFNTTNHKSTISQGGAAEDEVETVAGRWANIAAITSAVLAPSAGNFDTGSTFLLGVVDERYLVEEDLLAAPGTIDFNGISGDGHDLAIIGYPRGTVAAAEDELELEVNADGAAASYNTQRLLGTAAATSAATANDNLIGWIPADNAVANAFGAFVGFINQYAETTNYPTYLTLNGYHETTGPTSRVGAYSGRYNAAVAALTRVEFYGNGAANLATGSLFSLYRVPRYVIDRQELTAATPTITFSDIPQEYQALQLNVYARSDDAIPISDDVAITLNTDAGPATFDYQYLEGTGAGPPTAARSAASNVLMTITAAGEGANEFSGGTVTFPRYERTDGHKHFITLSGTNENQVILRSSRWENLAAITRIDLDPVNGANFAIGSVFELVGLMPTKVLDITVDSEVKGIADGNIAVPDTANDWTFVEAAAMPYMEYHRITINGTLQQDIVWRYGSVFHDTSCYALDFNPAPPAYVEAACPQLDFTSGDFSIIARIVVDSLANYPHIFTRGLESNDGYEFYLSGGTPVLRTQQSGSNKYVQGDTAVSTATWYTLGASRSGVDGDLYVDGLLQGLAIDNDLTDPITCSRSAKIGVHDDKTQFPFNGRMQFVMVYNRALSEAEHLYVSNNGWPQDETGLALWLKMEEGYGAIASDSSAYGTDGTITGATWVNGSIGRPAGTSGTNDATPTFRSASSDLDVSANMTSFLPISQAQAPAYALGAVNPFITGTGNMTGNFTTVPAAPAGGFPLAGVIVALSNATSTPSQLPLLIIAGFAILAASLTTSSILRRYGSGTLLVKAFVIIGFMGVFISLGNFGIDFWMLVIFAILATALAMMSKQISWS